MNTIELITKHFEEQRKPLLAIARRRLGDFWCEDAVQDTYERVLKYADAFIAGRVLDSYVKKILARVILRYERDNVAFDEVEEWMWESGELAVEMRTVGILGEVLRDIEEMDEPRRSSLYLTMVSGEKVEKVSQITGMTEDAIKSACKRFRKEVKDKYELDS